MISARALAKHYRENNRQVTVFDDLNLECAAGDYVALMGASGAGKTSLLQLLGCLDRPDGGEYRLDGELVSAMDEEALAHIRNRKIGFVFQTNYFVEYLDLVDNVALPGQYGVAQGDANLRERARALLTDVGLAHRLHHLPGELSGGERQRAAIARALFNSPGLLLADEPTGNLDEENTARVLSILEDVQGYDTAMILVTHDRHVANRAARLLTLRQGQLEETR